MRRDARPAELIAQLGLAPHPEGGFYAEVFRSIRVVEPLDGRPRRSALTSIYFLLTSGGISRWHLVGSDEVWCHLEGAPLVLHQLNEDTRHVTRTRLGPVGPDLLPQATVPAGVWQAAQTEGLSEGDYTLVACMVAPGFDFSDFRLMDAGTPLAWWLREAWPELAALM
jgi:predicted cupin superfamily sugar epimerase